MSNPLTDVFTSAPAASSAELPGAAGPIKPMAAITTRFSAADMPTWASRSSLQLQLQRLQAALESTVTSVSTHPVLVRIASHPLVQQLACKLNVHPHVIIALALATCALAISAVVSANRVLSALAAMVPIAHSLRALERNDAHQLKATVKLWLLYVLTTPRRAKTTHLLVRLVLLTYRPSVSASMAYALVVRPLAVAAVKHGLVPRPLAVTYLGMDPETLDVQARSPVDDVPVLVQKAVGLVATARPEVGRYLGVEPGSRADWVVGSEDGGGRSRVATEGHPADAAREPRSVQDEAHASEQTFVHVRNTSNGVLGLASVKLQHQLGTLGHQFVDAEEPEPDVARGVRSGKAIGGHAM